MKNKLEIYNVYTKQQQRIQIKDISVHTYNFFKLLIRIELRTE